VDQQKLVLSHRPAPRVLVSFVEVTRRTEKVAKKVEKLREAKVTTLRRVLLARSCAMEEEDVV